MYLPVESVTARTDVPIDTLGKAQDAIPMRLAEQIACKGAWGLRLGQGHF